MNGKLIQCLKAESVKCPLSIKETLLNSRCTTETLITLLLK